MLMSQSAAVVSPAAAPTPIIELLTDTNIFSDAGSTAAVNNDAIQEWHDALSNGKEATQTTGGDKPLYKASIQNGEPAVLFDGSGDSMDLSALFTSTGEACHMFITLAPIFASGFDTIITLEKNIETAINGTSGYLDCYVGADLQVAGAAASKFTNAGLVDTSWKLLEITYDGGTRTDIASYTVVVDGSSQTLSASNNVGASAQTNQLGNGENGSYAGYIGDVAIYDQILTGSDLTDKRSAINTKWGL
jgi:hypothetical protein